MNFEALAGALPGDRTEPVTADDLHARYLGAVFRYVVRRVGHPQEAEDVTAAVFAAAVEALPRFRGDCPPRAWLLGIARRKVADHLRWARRRACEVPLEHVETPPGAGAEGDCLKAEGLAEVRQIVQSLPPDQREALLLKYVDELSTQEVAAVLGRSPAAVNSLLQRARAAVLRRGAHLFEPE